MDHVQKRVLRKQIRSAVAECDKSSLHSESEIIMSQIEELPEFREARVVALYWSMDDEVSTHDFVRKWYCKKRILLPVTDGDNMTFRHFTGAECLAEGAFGISEPKNNPEAASAEESVADIESIDMIVVPGVAFDRCGHRMGRGCGYYDRFLASRDIYKVGVCFAAQLTDSVPCEDHDIVMDKVISSKTF